MMITNCTITITADLALLVDPTRIFQLIHRCTACNMERLLFYGELEQGIEF